MAPQTRYRLKDSTVYKVQRLAGSLFNAATSFYMPRFGLGVPEMRVISTISGYAPLTSSEVVEIAAMDKALVSRVTQRLVKRGFVESTSDPGDQRKRVWQLTESGVKMAADIQIHRENRQARVLGCITAKERTQLNDMLDRLVVASEALRAEEAAELREMAERQTPKRRAKSAA